MKLQIKTKITLKNKVKYKNKRRQLINDKNTININTRQQFIIQHLKVRKNIYNTKHNIEQDSELIRNTINYKTNN